MIKRYLTIILLCLSGNILLAQRVPAYGGGADLHDLSFGFSFTYLTNYFKIDKKPDWQFPYFDAGTNQFITSRLTSISSKNSQGFAVGFLTRYTLEEHVEVRSTPSLIFADRSLSYTYADPSQNTTKLIQTTTVDFPLEIKLKTDRIGDFRGYLLGGAKYSVAIGSKKNTDANADPLNKLVKNVGGYGSYEAGLGCDIYFEFFKLSPEIKISNSFGNVLVPEDHPFSTPINKLSLHTVMFSLIFE